MGSNSSNKNYDKELALVQANIAVKKQTSDGGHQLVLLH